MKRKGIHGRIYLPGDFFIINKLWRKGLKIGTLHMKPQLKAAHHLSRGRSGQSDPGLRATGLSSGLFWHCPPAQPLNFSTLRFSHLVKAGRYSFPNTTGSLRNRGYCSSEAEAVTGKTEVSQRRGCTCLWTAGLLSPETRPLPLTRPRVARGRSLRRATASATAAVKFCRLRAGPGALHYFLKIHTVTTRAEI